MVDNPDFDAGTVSDAAPAPSGDVAVRAANLSKRFGDLVAVSDVSFDIEAGEIFGFLGPNGSGKSTVIRMLCGLLKPNAGDASIAGHSVTKAPDRVRESIGYMSQAFSLYSDLTVEENLTFFGRVYGLTRHLLRTRKSAVMELVGLTERRKQLAGTLSGGWRQRLALACSIVHDPPVIFLDEPTAGIDPVARRELWDLLFDLSGRGHTLFVTTHYMDEAERCSRVGYIYLSKLIVLGRPAELKAMPDVTPQGTRWAMVQCRQTMRALMAARTMPEVLDATIFGENLHLKARADSSNDAIAAKLAVAGITDIHVRDIGPSLEDVFVSLTKRHAAMAPHR